jgi:hypothetical protein
MACALPQTELPRTFVVRLRPRAGIFRDWWRVTVDHGLYIVRDVSRYDYDEAGTGRLGSFAAYRGNCDVERELEWLPLSLDYAQNCW